MKETIKSIKEIESGSVVSLAIYDEGEGLAEFVNCTDSGIVTVKWFEFNSCYDCQVFDKNIFTENSSYNVSDIAELSVVDYEGDVEKRRAESIKENAPVFKRYKKLQEKNGEER